MSGLILKLAAGERFVINGTILEIGDKPAKIRISDSKACVLRCRDALMAADVNTPVKQIYYAIQLLITWDLDEQDVLPAIYDECSKLEDVFSTIDAEMLPRLRVLIDLKNYYSAMCLLRKIMALESNLLNRHISKTAPPLEVKVA